MTTDPTPVLKHPSACTVDELDAFRALVRANGQARTGRVPESELLAFLHNSDGQLIAVGALKNPDPDYRRRVFTTYAGLTTTAGSCPVYEVGFFSIARDWQRQGLGRRILQALVNEMCTRRYLPRPGHRGWFACWKSRVLLLWGNAG